MLRPISSNTEGQIEMIQRESGRAFQDQFELVLTSPPALPLLIQSGLGVRTDRRKLDAEKPLSQCYCTATRCLFDAYIHLVPLLQGADRLPEALSHANARVTLRPDIAGARNNLGTPADHGAGVRCDLAQYETAAHIDRALCGALQLWLALTRETMIEDARAHSRGLGAQVRFFWSRVGG